jgi:hypothetical protein
MFTNGLTACSLFSTDALLACHALLPTPAGAGGCVPQFPAACFVLHVSMV